MTQAPAPVGPVAVAAGPIGTRLGDVDGNFARAAGVVAAATRAGARLVVLPELATSGYVFRSHDEAASAAVTDGDPRWRSLSRAVEPGAVVVVGFAERAGDVLFSSAAVVGHDGIIAVYRKAHLWGDEALFFAAGDAAPPVVPTPVGRVGVAICYDAEFPEVPRTLALGGADLLALPVNWPRVPRPTGERPPETVLAMAAARASRLPVVVADRSGHERGVEWTDGSAVIGPDGWILSAEPGGARGAALSTAELDLGAARDKRVSPCNDLFRDRRPELYGPTAPPAGS